MKNNRKEFSAKTIRIAAERVSFICSRPGCNQITIGPSDNGGSYKGGEGCHIYAASPNGPRSNSSISSEFLKSPDNCIWLCNQCHNMVDANPNQYSPELLKEWKQIAEKRAEELSKNKLQEELFFNNNKDGHEINEAFDKLFQNGNFDMVAFILSSGLNSDTLSPENQQCIYLNKLKYDAFRNRSAIEEDVSNIKKSSQFVKDKAAEFAFSTYDSLLLRLLGYLHSSEDIRFLCSAIERNEPWRNIFFASPDENKKKYSKEIKALQNSAIGYGAFIYEIPVIDENGKQTFIESDWLLKTFASIARLEMASSKGESAIIKNGSDGKLLISNYRTYLSLDDYYQRLILPKVFMLFRNDAKILSSFFDIAKEAKTISPYCFDALLSVSIDELKKPENLKEIIELSRKGFFSSADVLLYSQDTQTAITFVEGNLSSLSKDIVALKMYCLKKKSLDSNFDSLSFLLKTYQGDKESIDYHIVLGFFDCESGKTEDLLTEIAFIKKRIKITDKIHPDFIELLDKAKDFEFLSKLSIDNPYVYVRTCIADALAKSNESKYLKRATDILCELEKSGFYVQDINRKLIYLYSTQNELSKALDRAEKEFNQTQTTLFDLYIVNWRLYLNKIAIDSTILTIVNRSIDPKVLCDVSSIYEKNGQFDKAKEVALKGIGISLDSSNPCIKKIWELEMLHPSPEKKESNVFSFVKLDDDTKSFFILPDENARYFQNGMLLNYTIRSESESSQLFFLSKGSNVTIDGKAHQVKEVHSFYSSLVGPLGQILAESKQIQMFRLGEKGHEFDQLKDLLNQGKEETIKAINFYFSNQVPLSLLPKMLGRRLVETTRFVLFSDKGKIFSPMEASSSPANKYLLDFGAIFLLAFCGIQPKDIDKTNVFTVCSIGESVSEEISSWISSIDEGKSPGTIGTNEDSKLIMFEENNQSKRETRVFLSNLSALISYIPIVPDQDSGCKTPDSLITLLQSHDLAIEKQLLQNANENTQLVTNNRFLSEVGSIYKFPTVDFTAFLMSLQISTSQKIECLERIQMTNMGLYFRNHEYSILKSEIESHDTKARKTEEEAMIDLLKGTWKKMTDDEKARHDNLIVVIGIQQRSSFTDNMSVISRTLYNEYVRIYSNNVRLYFEKHNSEK